MARLDHQRDSVSEVAVLKPVSGSGSLKGEQRSASASWSLLRSLRWRMKYDENWHRDLSLGHRVGFYQIKGNIGKGNFSSVKIAIHALTKERVGVKVIDKTKLDEKTTKMLLREIKLMDACNHPNLVRLYEVLENKGKLANLKRMRISKNMKLKFTSFAKTRLYFIMQYGEGGELFTKITNQGKFPESRARDIFRQVGSAVSYMHHRGMIHRDIKAENVFFTSRDHILLGDLGFAKRLDSMDQHLTTFCGSPPYAAPELFVDDHYIGPSVDVWALGILLYFMVTGSMPFNASTVAALKTLILAGKFTVPSYVSPACGSLLRSVLQRKSSSRPDLTGIMASDWMAEAGAWIEADPGYRSCPRLGATEDDLTEAEILVMEELEQMGITEAVLRQDIMLGVRSPVIATFRILLHNKLETAKKLNLSTSKQNVSLKRSSIKSQERSSSESKINLSSSKDIQPLHKESKFCDIL